MVDPFIPKLEILIYALRRNGVRSVNLACLSILQLLHRNQIINFAYQTLRKMESDHIHERDGRATSLLSHVLFILIIFVLPEVLMTFARPHRISDLPLWSIYGKTFIYVGVFYLNYFLLIPRTVIGSKRNKKILRLILINIVVIVAALFLSHYLDVYFDNVKHFRHPSFLKSLSFVTRDAMMLVLTVALAVALRLGENLRDVESKHKEMISIRRQTELDNLKSQLNPHFLFNTLNTIYALIEIDPTKAQDAVHQLSGLLRYTLYDDANEVELQREVEFIRSYASLMQMRLGKRPVNLDIDLQNHGAERVPPLMLLPLVENAFKYGNTPVTTDPIDITIKIQDNRLVCTTCNAFVPVTSEGKSKDSGVGLANVRRRLVLLYGSKAYLHTSISGNQYHATLSIPLL